MGICSLGGYCKTGSGEVLCRSACAADWSFHGSSNEENVIKLLASRCGTVPVSQWSYSVVGLGLGQVLLLRSKRENLFFGSINILALLMCQC